MPNIQRVTVSSKPELRSVIATWAAKGFTTVSNDGDLALLSRKKPFNWVLAILCLFVPVFGWIALVFMIMAAGRGSEVVEISLEPAAPLQRPTQDSLP
jgi:hypothetical protein